MDTQSSQVQSMGDARPKGRNIYWTDEMDRCLIYGLLHQTIDEQKCPNGFKDVAYNVVVMKKVSEEFNLPIERRHVDNRIKTMKKDYRIIHELQKKSVFGCDNILKKLEICDDVWNKYV